VITLDRIRDIDLIREILKHENIGEQIKEWQELGVVDDKFTVDNVLVEGQLSKKYEHLPIDTTEHKEIVESLINSFRYESNLIYMIITTGRLIFKINRCRHMGKTVKCSCCPYV